MDAIVRLALLSFGAAVLFVLVIALVMSIAGSHENAVAALDKKVKRGERIPITDFNFWIWMAKTFFGGVGARRFILFCLLACLAGAIVGILAAASNLIGK